MLRIFTYNIIIIIMVITIHTICCCGDGANTIATTYGHRFGLHLFFQH